MCSFDVPKGVCPTFNRSTWRQIVLPAVNQHTVASQGWSSDEGVLHLNKYLNIMGRLLTRGLTQTAVLRKLWSSGILFKRVGLVK